MNQPALDTLPIELALHILLQCTAILVTSERPRATQIALVSKATFTTVAPLLYRTLVLTGKNIRDPDDDLVPVETFDRVLPYVRHLSAFGPCFNDSDTMDWLGALLKRWRPPSSASLYLDVPWHPLSEYLCAKHDTRVTGIRITYNSLSDTLFAERDPKPGHQSLPPEICHRLTHLVGWIPSLEDLGGWARSIASSLPSLTHLGLQVIELRYQHFDRQQFRHILDGMVDMIREFFKGSPRVECISLRFAGLVIHEESDREFLRGVVDKVRDERLKIWLDQRFPKDLPPKDDADDDDESWDGRWDEMDDDMDVKDAMMQRDFWTPEARSEATVYQFIP